MGAPVKTQVKNGLSKIFNFRGQTIDVSDQAVLILKYSGLHDEEGNKINVRDPLTAAQKGSGRFKYFMMTVHSDQAAPNCNYRRITCRACIQLPLCVDGIYSIIDTQMLENPILL